MHFSWEDLHILLFGSRDIATLKLLNSSSKVLGLIGIAQDYLSHCLQFSSVQSLSCVNSLWPHESQHARPPCPSPSPRVYSNSHPSSQWCHPAISSSVIPFSSCPQSLTASESFPMSQLFAWGGQSTGVSALASFFPNPTQGWSLERTGWNSLQSKGLSRVFSNTTVQKQRHYFANKGPSSQGYDFSSSHLWMWELDCEESWAPKN